MVLVIENLVLAPDAAVRIDEILDTAVGTLGDAEVYLQVETAIHTVGDDISGARLGMYHQLAVLYAPAFRHVASREALPTLQIAAVEQQLPPLGSLPR